jgi:hypothetical protein
MKRKEKPIIGYNTPGVREYGWGNAHLLFEDSVSRLVGRLLTHIEACGMSASQEKALKAIIKNEVYATLDDAWIIGAETHSELRKKAYEFGQLSMGGKPPQQMPYVGNTPRAAE